MTPADWIQSNFWIPELRGPIQLTPYQYWGVNEALSKNEKGQFKYSIIVWSDIKKSAKSSIAAAIALYMSEQNDWSEGYVIANDLKQADSRVSFYMRRAIELNTKMRGRYRQKGYLITAPNRSRVEAIPIDPSGEAGSNADFIIFSELWGANEDAKQRMWSEMTLSPTKFGKSFRWIESYAGFTEESHLLYTLYETGVKNGTLIAPDLLFQDNLVEGGSPLKAYKNEEARMFCLWNDTPRCPWQTDEYYRSEASILTPKEFARMHRNQWVTSEETFVPIEWWYGCVRAEMPKPDKNTSMVVSMDAGIASDTFGLLMGWRHPEFENEIVVEHAIRWIPPKGGRLDFQGTDERPGPERVLRQWIEDYNVVEVTYDEHQLADMAMRLSREGLAWFKRFSQGNDRLVADSMLRDKIRDRRIWHKDQKDLTEHIYNANAKTDEKEDRKIRIVKRSENLKIDLAVCLSQATHEIMRLNL